MGQVKGITRRELLNRHYREALHDLNVYMEGYRQNIDTMMENYKKQGSSNFFGVASIPFNLARGLAYAIIDANNAFQSISAQFSNDINYLLDPEREEHWREDLKYVFSNLGASMLEGITGFTFGAAADFGHLVFGADTSWADDPIEGVIANFNRIGNQLRANALDPNAGAFEGVSAINRGFWTGLNEKLFNEDPNKTFSDLEWRDYRNKAAFENRWQTERPRGIGEGSPPSQQNYFDEEILNSYSTRMKERPDPFSEDYRDFFNARYNISLPSVEKPQEEPREWTQEELQEDARRYAVEQHRYDIFQELEEHFRESQRKKENWDRWTAREFFEKKAGNSTVYKYAEPVFFSLGRLIPSFVMTKFSGGTGLGATAMRVGSRAWFAGSVAGGAMEEAVLNGASMEDALSFAFGSAANELIWAQAGGIRLGDASSLAILSQRKVFRTMLIEAAEEMMIEQGYRGLEHYSSPDNIISRQDEKRNELWERTFYSGMVGGLSGFFMGEISFIRGQTHQGQVKQLNQALYEAINAKGIEGARADVSRIIKKLEKRLNSDLFLNENAKNVIMADPIASQLFNKTDSGYQISEIGRKIQQGDILAKQGNTTITTNTHAVSQENYFGQLQQTVKVVNPETNRLITKPIQVVTKQQMAQSKNAGIAQEVLKSGMNVAFVEVSGRNVQATSDGFDAFYDPSSGITYVNIHSEAGFENLLTHEIHDTLSDMSRRGLMTKQGREAYSNFLDMYASETSSQMFQDLGVTFNEAAYAQAYKGRENFASLMQTERVSAFLQQAMNNQRIIEQGLRKNRNIFEGIASLFTRKAYYNRMLKEMGIDAKTQPRMARSLAKLERSFINAMRANKQQIKKADNLANNLFGQKGLDNMFSIDNHKSQIEMAKEHLYQNFFDVQNGVDGIPGLNVENFLQTENLSSFLDFHIQNPQTTYEIVQEQNKRFDSGFFLKVNDTHYFNKAMFNINKDMFIKDISFNQNSHHFTLEVVSKKNPKQVSMIRRSIPSIEHNGRIINNSNVFEASMGLEQLRMMNTVLNKAETKNLLISPAQSFAVSSTSGNEMFTSNFGPVTLILKKDISQERDFVVWKQDIGSIGRTMAIDSHYFDMFFGERIIHSDVRASNKVEILKNVLAFNKNIAAPRIMAEAFNIIPSENPTTQEMSNITHDIFEAIRKNETSDVHYETMFKALDTLKIDHTNQMTLQEIKKAINVAQDAVAINLFELQNQAISSFEHLVNEGVKMSTLFGYLNYYDLKGRRGTAKSPEYAIRQIYDQNQVDIAESNQQHFNKINEYLETIEYHLSNMGMTSEGKMELRANHIETVLLNPNHKDVKGNPKLIAQIQSNLENLQQQMQEQNMTPFKVLDRTNYNNKQEMFQQEIINQESGNNVLFSMNNKKAKTLDNKSVENIQQDTEQATQKTSRVQQLTIDDILNQQDFYDQTEKAETKQTITDTTQNKLAQNVSTKKGKTIKQTINRFKQAQKISKTVNKVNYHNFEVNFADNIDASLQKRLKKPKTKLDKTSAAIYNSLQHVVKKQKTNREFYNHMGSNVAKTLIHEMTTLSELIQNDANRTTKTPTDVELEYIVRQVNKAMFQTLDYVDSDVRIEINKSNENPLGYAFTRGIYWYLRDMKNVKTWNAQTVQEFQDNHLGFPYRRLINSILNFNKKNGARELNNAMAHFAKASRVENVSDLALDNKAPRTINNAKIQWERNTSNIQLINNAIDFQPGFTGALEKSGLNSWLDAFTVGESHAHWSDSGWAVVLNDKLIQATERKLQIDRMFKEHFEKGNFLKKNYKNIVQLDNPKNAINVKNLGNIKVNPSQIIYLRNMMLREIVRNRAIDLGLIRGEKSNHFNDGNLVDILGKSFLKDARVDNKQVGTISNSIDLLNELDNIINQNSFMGEYNTRVMEFFNDMYPYVNERFKEINGMNLQNDGQLIRERLEGADPMLVRSLFNGMPSTLNLETIANIYVPFLLDNSGYFKQNKIDFSTGIIDMGVFDGMTQEISDSNAVVSVESITDVISAYSREVANYYALHRVMNDFNRVLNERLDGYEQTTYVGRNIPKQAITFYQNLLNDMAGYRPRPTNPKLNRTLTYFRRNFYRASLGANLRVIGSQVTTMFNLSNIYGSHFTEMFPKMMTNFFAQHTKANKSKLKYLEDNNHIYWDRKRSASFEVGEATTEGIFSNNAFNRTMQNLMKGIKFTDGSINRALYLTLLETTNSNTGQKYTQAEASNEVANAIIRSQSSVLAIAKSPLLRTHNELFRVMLRFLGEPMKLITQSYNSMKQMQYLNKLEANRSKVIEALDNEIKRTKEVLKETQKEVSSLEAQENSDNFNNLSEAEQKAIHKSLDQARERESIHQEAVIQAEMNKQNTLQDIDQALANAPKAKRLARKRYTAFVVAMMYLTFLRSGFDLVRSKGGAKDKPDEQEFMEYLARLVGRNFMDSLTGSFPFVREAYQTLGSGYSSTGIAEFAAIDDVFVTSHNLIRNLVGGNDINVARTIRNFTMASGRLLGIPTYQLERMFTTPTLYVNESLHYRYHSMIGRQTRDNIELKRAIERGDTKMIEAIVDRRIASRGITVSNPVSNELVRLYGEGEEVRMSGVNKSFTVDGETFEMTRAQRHEFARIYNQADYIIHKIIGSVHYRRLNDDMKRSVIQAVYNYYYNLAKQKISGKDIIPEQNNFRTLHQAYNYFVRRAQSFYQKQRSPSYIREQREKALT